MIAMSAQEFETAVSDALGVIPADLMSLLDNVAFFIEDEPPEDDPDLLGLYEGVALTERDAAGRPSACPTGSCSFVGR